MTDRLRKSELCYKCKETLINHKRCSRCSILTHPKDPKCTCKLTTKEFILAMQNHTKKTIKNK